ncbi:hypothetical protein GCM10010387_66670 [Streptomyces inusitatus]|uniref:Uncharacterized protein n=1 Tax=Streptomyces inusitatus TaxID=68221 RepID=A0A918QQR9_9ACTN|nr:hypothetical protein GCM10010387_66670 [Streptomyces inusitatus]
MGAVPGADAWAAPAGTDRVASITADSTVPAARKRYAVLMNLTPSSWPRARRLPSALVKVKLARRAPTPPPN